MSIAIAVNLVSYNHAWPRMAAQFSKQLGMLGELLTEVHHIGSTSVPGLTAKPVIDLMPLVSDLAELDRKQADVEAIGYGWHGEYGVDGRRFCTLADPGGTRIAQLHFYEYASPHAKRQIAFRDYLRAFPDVAGAYAIEKHRACALFPHDSTAYSKEKGAWIQRVEKKALAWSVGEPALGW